MSRLFFILISLFFNFCSNAFEASTKNKTIMITAATGAFGKAISSSLAADGYNLILVSFLLSNKSAHINGSNIVLDGGESSAY